MSITAANAVALTGENYPTATGQILANVQPGPTSRAIYGTAEVVLDGSLTAFDVNWIDGSATLSWTPTVVLVTRIPSSAATDATSTIGVTQVSTINTTKMTVQISAAGTNTHKFRICFFAF